MPGTCAPATGLCAYPPPPCGTSTGDPHLRTFDGLFYDQMAAGDFLLVHTPDLTIQVRQTRIAPAIAINTAAVVQTGADRIAFSSLPHRVWVNGADALCASEPARLAGGTWCSRHGDVVALHTAHADVNVNMAGMTLNISVSLPPEVTDITGLLGSRDGDPQNDLTARTGEVLGLSTTVDRFYDVFVASWVVSPADSLFGADAAGHTRDGAPASDGVSTRYAPPVRAFSAARDRRRSSRP